MNVTAVVDTSGAGDEDMAAIKDGGSRRGEAACVSESSHAGELRGWVSIGRVGLVDVSERRPGRHQHHRRHNRHPHHAFYADHRLSPSHATLSQRKRRRTAFRPDLLRFADSVVGAVKPLLRPSVPASSKFQVTRPPFAVRRPFCIRHSAFCTMRSLAFSPSTPPQPPPPTA